MAARYVDIARSIATVGMGVGAGGMIGISLTAYPTLQSLGSSDRLNAWNVLFDASSRVFPVLLESSSVLFLSAAYFARPGFGLIGSRRRLLLAYSGLSALFVIPWTRMFMWPNIQWLKHALHAYNAGAHTDAAIKRWEQHHRVRTAVVALGFVAAVLELLATGDSTSFSSRSFNISFSHY